MVDGPIDDRAKSITPSEGFKPVMTRILPSPSSKIDCPLESVDPFVSGLDS